MLGSFFRMVFRMQMMTMRHVGMMGSLFMIARFMMLGGFSVVLAGVFVMFGSLVMMFRYCVFHVSISSTEWIYTVPRGGSLHEANRIDITW
jgi:hypothetical protein